MTKLLSLLTMSTLALTFVAGTADAVLMIRALHNLSRVCEEMVEGYVIDHVLQPLARTIAMR